MIRKMHLIYFFQGTRTKHTPMLVEISFLLTMSLFQRHHVCAPTTRATCACPPSNKNRIILIREGLFRSLHRECFGVHKKVTPHSKIRALQHAHLPQTPRVQDQHRHVDGSGIRILQTQNKISAMQFAPGNLLHLQLSRSATIFSRMSTNCS